METIKGKIVSGAEKTAPEPEKSIEFLTNPVPVSRYRLPFAAVAAVQTVVTVLLGVFLWYAENGEGAAAEFAAELVRRLTNG